MTHPWLYPLVFLPFTVIDHHKSYITIGVGLLSMKDVDSYKWLLEQFMKAHSDKQPLLVLTDQDTTLKQVVESVFSQSKHRLCMWLIMKKLPKKKRFNKLVWHMYIERPIFERSCELLMKESNLEDEKWFKDIYENKKAWVPAYFNDFARCELMKTTSRSESINSFFNTYSETESFFLNFMMNYDAAIKKQCYTQRELDHKTNGPKYSWRSPHMIEQHAAKVYTSKVELKYDEKEDVISVKYQLLRDRFDEEDEEVTKLVNEVFLNVETALDIVRHDKQKLACLAEKTEFLLNEVKSNCSSEKPITNSDILEKHYDVTILEEVEIFVPEVQHNKGSRKKRLIGEVEKAVMNAQMKTRKCSLCGKREPHSRRSCQSIFNAQN
uniref:MULE transposase domain-containing protein n=1 Tax=Lactuca sativa TaxID=4236 RepID=A0A9R1VQA3_LACSA|nr:hypothetical protein LSAT_V11C400178050 [Lactuca sativa]